jgi:hypothetical protein
LIKAILHRRVSPPLIWLETAVKPLNPGEALLLWKTEDHPMKITVKSPAAGR